MTIARDLERELVNAVRRNRGEAAVAAAAGSGRLRRRSAWLRPPVLLAVLGCMLALAGVALAAEGLLGGAALQLRSGVPVSPRAGYGLPRPGGVHLLPISIPDPSGGPPWGARYVVTTRGVGCLQLGRLYHGELGVIGQDGAFSNDGRFHPLPVGYLQGAFPCATLDAHGHAFAATVIYGAPASGLIEGGEDGGCVAPGQPQTIREHASMPVCARSDERLVLAGLAGPRARRVFYRDEGTLRSVAAAGSDGAYLIVMRMQKGERDDGSFSPYVTGVGGGRIVKIDYSGGFVSTCAPTRASGERVCPAIGEAASAAARLTPASVRSPVSVKVRGGRRERRLLVSFKARVAVASARSQYWISVRVPGRGDGCGDTVAGPVFRDVRRGAEIRYPVSIGGACAGRLEVTVTYTRGGASSGLPTFLFGGRGRESLVVGRRSVLVR